MTNPRATFSAFLLMTALSLPTGLAVADPLPPPPAKDKKDKAKKPAKPPADEGAKPKEETKPKS